MVFPFQGQGYFQTTLNPKYAILNSLAPPSEGSQHQHFEPDPISLAPFYRVLDMS